MRFLALSVLLMTPLVFAQQPAAPQRATAPAGPKLIPPPGVAIVQADERTLRTGLTRLTTMIDSMKGNPHIADVMIFQRAIKFALDGNGFFAPDDVFKGKELLRMGLERADQLSKGDAPWTRVTGLVVRGYISKNRRQARSPMDCSCPPGGPLLRLISGALTAGSMAAPKL